MADDLIIVYRLGKKYVNADHTIELPKGSIPIRMEHTSLMLGEKRSVGATLIYYLEPIVRP